jgi:2-polyprenyl-6-methoxyphenol hydroxylase-like FAD-dependent oxidoreductase
MSTQGRAIVVGAGLGGLTAALELERSGFDVAVFERRTELAEVATGLSLWAFGIRRLAALGIADPETFGAPIERLVHRSSDGRLLTDVAVPRRAAGASFDIHRGKLQARLADAFGRERIRLGRRCESVRPSGDRVEIGFDGGPTETCGVLVGADGVNSVIRSAICGPIELRRNELGAWRGICEMSEDELAPGRHVRHIGAGALFGIGRLSPTTIRWYAGGPFPARPPETPTAAKASAVEIFGGWARPVRDTLDRTAADAYLFNDTPNARPLRTWGAGRVTLLGDAAHPMLPTLGIAGGVAIEDAAVLGECLREADDAVAGLRRYERRRRPVARRIVLTAAAFERALMTERAPLLTLREWAFRAAPQRTVLGWLAGGGRFRSARDA